MKPTFSRLQLLLATLIGNASVCDPVLIRNMTPVHTIIGLINIQNLIYIDLLQYDCCLVVPHR